MPLENEQKTWIELLKKNRADLFDLGYIFGQDFPEYATQNSDDGLIIISSDYIYKGLDKIYSKIKLKKFGSDPNPKTYDVSNGVIEFKANDIFYANEISGAIDIAYLWKFNGNPVNIINYTSNSSWKEEANLPTKGGNCTPESFSHESMIINNVTVPTKWMDKLGGMVKVPCYYINAKKEGNQINGMQLTAFSYKANRKNIEDTDDYSGQYFVENWKTNNSNDQKMDKAKFWSLYPEIYPEIVWNELDGTDIYKSNTPLEFKIENNVLYSNNNNSFWGLGNNDLVVVYRRTKGDIEPKSQIPRDHLWTAFPVRLLSRSREIRELTCEFDLIFDKEIECYEMPNYVKLDGSDSSLNYKYFTEENRISYNNNSFLNISENKTLTLTNIYTTSSESSYEGLGRREWCFQIGKWKGTIDPIKEGACEIKTTINIKKLPIIQSPNSSLGDIIVNGSASSNVSYEEQSEFSVDWTSWIKVFLTSVMPGTFPAKFPMFKGLDTTIPKDETDGVIMENAIITNKSIENEFVYESDVYHYDGWGDYYYCDLQINMSFQTQSHKTYAYAVVIWRNGKLALQ